MKKLLITVSIAIAALTTNVQAQADLHLPTPQEQAQQKSELKVKFQKAIDEADIVFEADFDLVSETETYLDFDETTLKLETGRASEHQLQSVKPYYSTYMKTDVVYKKPTNTSFKAGDIIDVADNSRGANYFSQKTKLIYGRIGRGSSCGGSELQRGRCLVFAKIKHLNTQYRTKYKDAISIEIIDAVSIQDLDEYKKAYFFGNKSTHNWEREFIDNYIYGNKQIYTYINFSNFVYPGVTTMKGLIFQTKADFQSFLKTINNINIERDPNYKTYDQIIADNKAKEAIEYQRMVKLNDLKIAKLDSATQVLINKRNALQKGKKSKANTKNKKAAVGTLNFSIQNQTITTVGTNRFLEFEITAKASGITNSYLEQALLTLQYNTAAFGSNIGNTAGAVTTTLGTGLNTTNYNFDFMNSTTNEIKLSVALNPIPTPVRTLVPTATGIIIGKVKLKILSTASTVCTAGLAFTNNTTATSFTFYSTTATTSGTNNYTTISYSAIPTFSICATVNTNILINPLPTTDFVAGNNDTLTITGSGFDTIQGKIQFTNANTGGVDDTSTTVNEAFTDSLESFHIIYWSKTKIKVLIPSYIDPFLTGNHSVAGRGPIKITNKSGKVKISNDSVATNIVKIKYSYINIENKNASGSRIKPLKIINAKTNCDNGFVFYLDPKFNTPAWAGAVPVIEKALLDWKTYINTNVTGLTNYELKLARDPSGNIIYTNNTVLNKIVIETLTTNSAMETSVNFSRFPKTTYPSVEAYRDYATISVNQSKLSIFDFSMTGNLPSNKREFYNDISHEIGHLLGLDHLIGINTTINALDFNAVLGTNYKGDQHLMYFAQLRSGSIRPSAQRISVLQNGLEAKDGVNKMLTYSKTKTLVSPNIANIGSAITPTPPEVLNSYFYLCNGTSTTINSLSNTNNQWYLNGAPIVTANNQFLTITYPSTGNPTLIYKSSLNCTSGTKFSNNITVNLLATGCSVGPPDPPSSNRLKSQNGTDSTVINSLNLNIYPNPSTGSFSIQELNNQTYTYQLINGIGSIVQQGLLTDNSNTISFSAKEPNGLYTLLLYNKSSGELLKSKIALQR